MKRIEITINGTVYPCSPTMGAMLRFKQETGREASEIDTSSLSDLCTFLWCCTASAAKREGIPFDYSLMDFADNVTPEDMAAWNEVVTAKPDPEDDASGEKKRKRR